MTPLPELLHWADESMTVEMSDQLKNGIETLHGQFDKTTFSNNFGDMIRAMDLDYIAISVWSIVFFIGIFLFLKKRFNSTVKGVTPSLINTFFVYCIPTNPGLFPQLG